MLCFFNQIYLPVFLNLVWMGWSGAFPQNVNASDQPNEVVSVQKNLETILHQSHEMYGTIDRFAWRPVTKQQLYTEIARAFYTTQNLKAPVELHRAASELNQDKQFREFLTATWAAARLGDTSFAEDEGYPDLICQTVIDRLCPGVSFVPPKQSRVNKQLAENQYVGIGIRVRFDEGRAIIDEPFPGGAARQAGAVPGDRILEVDGKSMEGLSLGPIVEILRGPKGSAVSVVVQNLDGSPPRTLDMVRTVVPIASVHGLRQRDDGSWQYVMEQESAIGYLKISQVVGSTSVELKEAARKLVDQGVNKVVLDLSELHDGDLHQVHMLADVLCSQGSFGALVSRTGETRDLETNSESAFAGLQVAVLGPREAMFGPVLSLLSMLKNRPNTQVIGPEITASLACHSTFDFSDRSGTLSGLVYAHLIPAALSSAELNIQPTKRIQFAPTVVENNPQTVQKLAMAWLR